MWGAASYHLNVNAMTHHLRLALSSNWRVKNFYRELGSTKFCVRRWGCLSTSITNQIYEFD